MAGDLPAALAGIAPSARETATAVAMKGYSTGFATALTVSAIMAIVSALMVYGLMHRGKPLPKA